MKLYFKSNRLAKVLNSNKAMIATYGLENAKKIQQRLAELKAANNLAMISHLSPPRCHELTGEDKGIFAVDVRYPFRLIFQPELNPAPRKNDGGIALEMVTEIIILDVKNYHKGY